jgi:hypothetical protein
MAQKWPSIAVREGAAPGSVAEALLMEEGVRLMLASKKDSNGGAAHRRTKKVVQGGALAARTRSWPWRGEEARRCSGLGDGGTAGSVSVMLGRRRPTMVWRGASVVVETKWLGGQGDVAPAWSSGGSDELNELHGSWARRSTDVEKSTTLLELGARAVAQRGSSEEAEDGGVEGGGGSGEGGGVEGGGTEVGQPDGKKPNFTVIRVSRRWGYSPYTRYIFGIG